MALETLLDVEKNKKKLDEAVHEKLKNYPKLQKSRRSFYVRLTEGTCEIKIRLDYIIGSYSDVKINKIKPVILNILRLSVYQIYEMDSVPESAIVNEAVKLTVKKGFSRLKGFVNAVLRSILRDKENIKWPDDNNTDQYISVKYSMPLFLVRKWLNIYGTKKTEEICKAFLLKHPVSIHVKDKSNAAKNLEKEGVTVKKADFPKNAYYIEDFDRIESLSEFKNGNIYIQDISSQLAVYCAGIKKDDLVLDMCAAPGGKSLLAADILKETGMVISRDVSENKVKLIKENVERMGYKNISAYTFDALVSDLKSERKFDVVMVDAPCSGYGIIGKKADIKYTASGEKEDELSKIQKEILNNAAKYVKKGGRLLFSTCTISKAENEDNVFYFLKMHPEFKAFSLDEYLPNELKCETSKKGYLQLLPCEKYDGFFIAGFELWT